MGLELAARGSSGGESGGGGRKLGAEAVSVHANVTLPDSFTPPAGGVRLRIRTPPALVGRWSKVSVGERTWTAVDTAAETVDFSARDLDDVKLREAMQRIVVWFE